jgi:hypothetical protein
MKKWIVLAAVLGLVAGAPTAQASILAPGGTTVTVDSISLSSITSTETLVGNTGVITAVGASFKAMMQTKVYQASGTNYLDFVYTITNEGPADLHRTTMFPYPLTSFTDVYYATGSAVVPTAADRGTDGTIGYLYQPPFGLALAPGMTETLVIRTHDTVFSGGLFNAIDGSTASVNSFAPAPLPSSLVLFGTGILGLAGRMARRLRKGWLCLA